jgi:Lsr2
MTKKVRVHLIDDLDASEASETVRFEVEGRAYEIDLSSRNAQKFRAEIAPYVQHARRVGGRARPRGRAGGGSGRPDGRPAAARSHVTTGGTGDQGSVPAYAGGPPPGPVFGGVPDMQLPSPESQA